MPRVDGGMKIKAVHVPVSLAGRVPFVPQWLDRRCDADGSAGKAACETSARRRRFDPATIGAMVDGIFGESEHAARVRSLSTAVGGAMEAASASIHLIGQALSQSLGLSAKHATKQVDRLVSNRKLDVWDLFDPWVRYVVADATDIVVALDWTDYAADGQTTIVASRITSHGRATPLVWKTHRKVEVTDGARNDLEDEVLLRLRQILGSGIRVTVVADRGFGDSKLYEFLSGESWAFVIRFRGNVNVALREGGPTHEAHAWVPQTGKAKLHKDVFVTSRRVPLAGFVAVHAKGMKEPWCLATNRTDLNASQIVAMYGKRFTIEESFRDTKDPRYGLGLVDVHIKRPDRRDRMLLIAVVAQALLTLLGAAAEAAGLDKTMKANTVTKRTHSLFRQGWFWYRCIPNMRQEWFVPLMTHFDRIVREQRVHACVEGLL